MLFLSKYQIYGNNNNSLKCNGKCSSDCKKIISDLTKVMNLNTTNLQNKCTQLTSYYKQIKSSTNTHKTKIDANTTLLKRIQDEIRKYKNFQSMFDELKNRIENYNNKFHDQINSNHNFTKNEIKKFEAKIISYKDEYEVIKSKLDKVNTQYIKISEKCKKYDQIIEKNSDNIESILQKNNKFEIEIKKLWKEIKANGEPSDMDEKIKEILNTLSKCVKYNHYDQFKNDILQKMSVFVNQNDLKKITMKLEDMLRGFVPKAIFEEFVEHHKTKFTDTNEKIMDIKRLMDKIKREYELIKGNYVLKNEYDKDQNSFKKFTRDIIDQIEILNKKVNTLSSDNPGNDLGDVTFIKNTIQKIKIDIKSINKEISNKYTFIEKIDEKTDQLSKDIKFNKTSIVKNNKKIGLLAQTVNNLDIDEINDIISNCKSVNMDLICKKINSAIKISEKKLMKHIDEINGKFDDLKDKLELHHNNYKNSKLSMEKRIKRLENLISNCSNNNLCSESEIDSQIDIAIKKLSTKYEKEIDKLKKLIKNKSHNDRCDTNTFCGENNNCCKDIKKQLEKILKDSKKDNEMMASLRDEMRGAVRSELEKVIRAKKKRT